MIAAREHTAKINYILDSALEKAEVSFSDLDAVAVSHHQGLMLSLVVGGFSCKIDRSGMPDPFNWNSPLGGAYLFKSDGTYR